MSRLSDEINEQFGGFWNVFQFILILFVCIRFSGAEWKTLSLDVRFLRSLYILLGVITLGIIVAIFKLAIARIESPSYWKNTANEAAISGLKLGIQVGGVVVFIFGILLVDGFLGPFQPVIETALKSLANMLPGG